MCLRWISYQLWVILVGGWSESCKDSEGVKHHMSPGACIGFWSIKSPVRAEAGLWASWLMDPAWVIVECQHRRTSSVSERRRGGHLIFTVYAEDITASPPDVSSAIIVQRVWEQKQNQSGLIIHDQLFILVDFSFKYTTVWADTQPCLCCQEQCVHVDFPCV